MLLVQTQIKSGFSLEPIHLEHLVQYSSCIPNTPQLLTEIQVLPKSHWLFVSILCYDLSVVSFHHVFLPRKNRLAIRDSTMYKLCQQALPFHFTLHTFNDQFSTNFESMKGKCTQHNNRSCFDGKDSLRKVFLPLLLPFCFDRQLLLRQGTSLGSCLLWPQI